MASVTGLLPRLRRPAISAPPPTIQNMMKPRNASSEPSRSPAWGRIVDADCASELVSALVVDAATVDMAPPSRPILSRYGLEQNHSVQCLSCERWQHAGFAGSARAIKVRYSEVESMFGCATALLSFAALCGTDSLEWPQSAVSLRRSECFPAFAIRQAEIEQDHVDAAARPADQPGLQGIRPVQDKRSAALAWRATAAPVRRRRDCLQSGERSRLVAHVGFRLFAVGHSGPLIISD